MKSTLPLDFNADFYLEVYEDVGAESFSPEKHYLIHGRQEHRYFSRNQLNADIQIVAYRGDFDPAFFQDGLDDDARDDDARDDDVRDLIRHYLLFSQAPPNDSFDAEFFRSYYAQTISDDENVYAFYCLHRNKSWCYPNAEQSASDASVIRTSEMFNADFYRRRYLKGRRDLDPAIHYLVEGFRAFNDPSEKFHGRSFALAHPDLVVAEMNPLIHWAFAGRGEGRAVTGIDLFRPIEGGRPFRPGLATIMIVSHEASRTGAPVVVLSLLRHLAERFNIVVLTLTGGPLFEEFRRNAVAMVDLGGRTDQTPAAVARIVRDWSPKAAILNTVVSAFEVGAFVAAKLAIITLIHDFAVYIRPVERMLPALALSDAVVFPAQIVRDSALAAAAKVGVEAPLTNLVILPQGRSLLPPSIGSPRELTALDKLRTLRAGGVRLVMGAGFVQFRKGVDLFIEVARQVCAADEMMHFVWVGAGYDPEKDAQVSVYLEDQIGKSDLDRHFTWISEVSDLSPLLSLCHAFFLSSRLDPFPNVALDAAAEGLPVVCFDGATGIADLAAKFPGLFVSVAYQDCTAAAEALSAIDIDKVDERTRTDYASWSQFQRYADQIGDIVEGAVRKRGKAEQAAAVLIDGEMDAPLFERSAPEWLNEGPWGVAATLSTLAEIAVRLDQNGFDGALLRPGRLTGRAAAAESYRHVSLRRTDPARAPLPCLSVVRSMSDVEQVARVIFDTPNHAAVATLIIPEFQREHDRLIDAVRSLRAGVVVRDAASIARVLGSTTPIHTWLVAGDTSASAAIRSWDQAASASFSSQTDVDVLLVEADWVSSGNLAGAAKEPAKRLAGLPSFLVDAHHLWLRTFCEQDIARWLENLDLLSASNAAAMQALLSARQVEDGATAVVDRSPRHRASYGEFLLGRDFAAQLDDRLGFLRAG